MFCELAFNLRSALQHTLFSQVQLTLFSTFGYSMGSNGNSANQAGLLATCVSPVLPDRQEVMQDLANALREGLRLYGAWAALDCGQNRLVQPSMRPSRFC